MGKAAFIQTRDIFHVHAPSLVMCLLLFLFKPQQQTVSIPAHISTPFQPRGKSKWENSIPTVQLHFSAFNRKGSITDKWQRDSKITGGMLGSGYGSEGAKIHTHGVRIGKMACKKTHTGMGTGRKGWRRKWWEERAWRKEEQRLGRHLAVKSGEPSRCNRLRRSRLIFHYLLFHCFKERSSHGFSILSNLYIQYIHHILLIIIIFFFFDSATSYPISKRKALCWLLSTKMLMFKIRLLVDY